MMGAAFDEDQFMTWTSASSDILDLGKPGFLGEINFFDVAPSLQDSPGTSSSMLPGTTVHSTPYTHIFNDHPLDIGEELMDLCTDQQHAHSANTRRMPYLISRAIPTKHNPFSARTQRTTPCSSSGI